MKGFTPLIDVYRHVIRHYFVPPRLKTYLPFFSLLLLGIFLLVLEFLGFRRVFRYMAGLQEFPMFFVQVLLERLIGLIFLISYSMIFMSSMINGLSALYLSANLPFLYSLPIPKWKVLTVKFVENWFLSCYLILLFLICFLFSHAYSFRLPWIHYAASIVLLALFTLSPVAFGSAVVTLLIRFFPVRRIHQLVTLIAGIFLAALMIAVRMMKPELLLNPTDTDDFVRLVQDLTVPSLSHLPSSWASHAIVYGGSATLLKLSVFGLFSVALLAVVLRFFYDKAFVYSQESRSIRKAAALPRRPVVKIRNKVAAMMIKDT
ncbi:MAG TPA: hypothetical protein VJ521_14395, partial [Acidobacteriota bacterium]|nr:hypothetical protein [Acidobacteriota bacterium]